MIIDVSQKYGVNVNWFNVAKLVGLQPTTEGLNQTHCICPFCFSNAIIIDEINKTPDFLHFPWLVCNVCKKTTNLISIVSRIWNLDYYQTIKKLNNLGFKVGHHKKLLSSTIYNFKYRYIDRDNRIKTLVEDLYSYENLNKGEFVEFCRKLKLNPSYDISRWLSYFYGILGLFKRNNSHLGTVNFRNVFNPVLEKIHNTKEYMFALVAEDIPNRVKGLWLCDKRVIWPNSWYYINLWPTNKCDRFKQADLETGFCFYPTLFQNNNLYTKEAFVLFDIPLALALHNRYFKSHSDILPLITATEGHFGRCRNIWKAAPNKDYIFIHSSLTKEMIAQAAIIEGKCFVDTTSNESIIYNDVAWLNKAKRKAQPWDIFLKNNLPNLTDTQVEAIFYELDINENRLEELLKLLGSKQRNRINHLLNFELERVNITCGSYTILEIDNRWVLQAPWINGEELLCDVIVRIDRGIVKNNKTYFQGRILYKNYQIPFTQKESDLRKQFKSAITSILVKQSIGIPEFGISNDHTISYLDVAIRFSAIRKRELKNDSSSICCYRSEDRNLLG